MPSMTKLSSFQLATCCWKPLSSLYHHHHLQLSFIKIEHSTVKSRLTYSRQVKKWPQYKSSHHFYSIVATWLGTNCNFVIILIKTRLLLIMIAVLSMTVSWSCSCLQCVQGKNHKSFLWWWTGWFDGITTITDSYIYWIKRGKGLFSYKKVTEIFCFWSLSSELSEYWLLPTIQLIQKLK